MPTISNRYFGCVYYGAFKKNCKNKQYFGIHYYLFHIIIFKACTTLTVTIVLSPPKSRSSQVVRTQIRRYEKKNNEVTNNNMILIIIILSNMSEEIWFGAVATILAWPSQNQL